MKRFSEFLREQDLKAPEVQEIETSPSPDESQENLETNWGKVIKDYKKTVKPPTYKDVKKTIQGNEKLSTGAIELDMTPKPKIQAPLPEPSSTPPQ